MRYILELRYQSGASRTSGFPGPNTYVAVQCVPDGVAPLRVLHRAQATQRGITLHYFGAGFRQNQGPHSRLGQAIAAAEAFIAQQAAGDPGNTPIHYAPALTTDGVIPTRGVRIACTRRPSVYHVTRDPARVTCKKCQPAIVGLQKSEVPSHWLHAE